VNTKSTKKLTSAQTVLKVALSAGFAITLLFLIFILNQPESDNKTARLASLAGKLERSASSSYWQWKAEEQPEMIMLVHYNANGRETDRRPVKISRSGWPKVEPSSEGCEDLWRMLLNVPMIIDGFKVFGEYFPAKSADEPMVSGKCRFRLSRGPYFDYHIDDGRVTLEID
jgi:hypothetical protein